jgi:hypothetical protein
MKQGVQVFDQLSLLLFVCIPGPELPKILLVSDKFRMVQGIVQGDHAPVGEKRPPHDDRDTRDHVLPDGPGPFDEIDPGILVVHADKDRAFLQHLQNQIDARAVHPKVIHNLPLILWQLPVRCKIRIDVGGILPDLRLQIPAFLLQLLVIRTPEKRLLRKAGVHLTSLVCVQHEVCNDLHEVFVLSDIHPCFHNRLLLFFLFPFPI